jgi:hypothetical protein
MIEPEVEPRHREAAVLAVRGSECNPNERGTALHWARTGMTYLENAYAAEERVARLVATLELHGGEWVACRPPTEFEPEGRDMPKSGVQVLFVWQRQDGERFGCMGCWSAEGEVWLDVDTDVDGERECRYASEVTHWRPYPALPEPEPAIESAEVASG